LDPAGAAVAAGGGLRAQLPRHVGRTGGGAGAVPPARRMRARPERGQRPARFAADFRQPDPQLRFALPAGVAADHARTPARRRSGLRRRGRGIVARRPARRPARDIPAAARRPFAMNPPAAPAGGFGGAMLGIARQAWPVLISQWAGIAFGVLDTAMNGHASATDLAAMSLSMSVYITIFVGLMGVVHALIPILAQHFGAGRHHEVGRTWGQGVWLALGLAAVGAVLMMFPDTWLSLSGDVAPEVRDRVAGYLRALALALPAALVFRTIYALGTALSRPKIVMTINLAAVGVKALLNWVLIYGHLGLPAMGATGAGLATAIVSWISLGIGLLVITRDRYFHLFALTL